MSFLSQAELVALLDALDNYHDQQIANMIRILLLTGARNSEVFKATWSQFNLSQGRGRNNVHSRRLSLRSGTCERIKSRDGGKSKSDRLLL
jgi:integrase